VPYFDQSAFDVVCDWGPQAVDALLPSDVLIVVDVLSFTTSVEVAVARGAAVLPFRWRDERAEGYAAEQNAVLASPKRWAEGEYSLAPSTLTSAPAGLRLVLPSPNGSDIAFRASSTGVVVAAACLRNARAVAEWAARVAHRVAIVCAGERWADGSLRPAAEDLIGAGAVIQHLQGELSPEAAAARAAFRDCADSLFETLLSASSGRELADHGSSDDVAIASELNVSECVPVLRGKEFVDERRSGGGERA
jgi:2-phosphosulfolactate phosphatase